MASVNSWVLLLAGLEDLVLLKSTVGTLGWKPGATPSQAAWYVDCISAPPSPKSQFMAAMKSGVENFALTFDICVLVLQEGKGKRVRGGGGAREGGRGEFFEYFRSFVTAA